MGKTPKEEFTGDRTADGLLDFVNRLAGTAVKLKPTGEAVVTLTDENFDAIVKDASKDVISKFDISGYPTLKLFTKASKAGEEYDSTERDAASLVKYLNSKIGTKRTPGGGFTAEVGAPAALSALAKEFKSGDKKALLAKAEADSSADGKYFA